MNDIKSLFKRRINWQSTKSGRAEWYAYVDGDKCNLHMNDFPDEPLYTLAYKGQSIDFDDKPIGWIVSLTE
jgi:hypothetical protein